MSETGVRETSCILGYVGLSKVDISDAHTKLVSHEMVVLIEHNVYILASSGY